MKRAEMEGTTGLAETLRRLGEIADADVRDTLTRAAQLVAERLGAAKVDVFLHDSATDSLVAVGVSDTPLGRKQRALGLDRLPLANGGPLVEVYRTGTPSLTGHADREGVEARGVTDRERGLGVRSTLAVPLTAGGERRGLLAVADPRPDLFSATDQDALVALAAEVGWALERAELTERVAAAAAATEERHRASDAERARLRAYFRQAPAAIAVTAGPEHAFEFVNPAYLDAMGRAVKDVLGRPIREVFPELAGQGIFEALDRVYRTGAPFRDPALALHVLRGAESSPEDVVFDVTYQPLRDTTGTVHGVLLQEVDVTELVRTRAQVAAEEALRRLQHDILRLATHDLRTPLVALKGRVDLARARLRKGGAPDPAWLDAQLAEIDAATHRMLAIIREVDDAARLRASEALDLEREPVDVAALARAVAAEVAPQRAVAVEAPEDPVVIDGDRVRLRRALHNLVGNAVKYSPAGTPIAVTVTARDALAVVAVCDRGVGIPAGELPRIFERFFRGSTVGAVAGTGLGLYGAKAIVEQHGGTIAVESVAGVGTSVTLTLPLALPGLPEHGAGA